MAVVLRFVDGTEDTRAVRLDLNNGDASSGVAIELDDVDANGQPDFGTAAIERTLADSEGRDGATVTSSKRPNREVRLPLLIHGTSAEAATAMGLIARECDRPRNLLEWTPDDASVEPVFFVVHQGEIEAPDYQYQAADRWACELTLLCEPAAISAAVEADFIVSNDPGRADGLTWTMPDVAGDVATPVWLLDHHQFTNTLLQHQAVDGGSSGTLVPTLAAQGTVATLVTGQGTTWVGGDYIETDFAQFPSMGTVSRANASGVATEFGQYRILVRVGASAAVADGDVRVRARIEMIDSTWLGDEVTFSLNESADRRVLDLGVAPCPPYSRVPYTSRGGIDYGLPSLDFHIDAARDSGSAELRIDALYLVPAELEAGTVETVMYASEGGASTNGAIYDTESDAIIGVVAPPLSDDDIVPPYVPSGLHVTDVWGVFPMLVPGVENRFTLVRDMVDQALVNSESTVTVRYHPRHLFVAAP